ncbi:MAG: hypothetical protein DSY76_02460 [Bacteroidetes bacterium]|nr:MAG: hypothetical protein DSY76_02460 [Bacteroidota bacterium]
MKNIGLIICLIVFISLKSQVSFSQEKVSSKQFSDSTITLYLDLAFYFYKKNVDDSVDYYFQKIGTIVNYIIENKNTVDTPRIVFLIKSLDDANNYYQYKRESFEQVNNYLSKQLHLAEVIGRKDLLAKINRRFGISYEIIGDYKQAIKYYRKSLSLSFSIGDSLRAAYTYIGIANIYKNWGQNDEALLNYRLAYDIATDKKDSMLISAAAVGLGNVYGKKDSIQTALSFYQESLELEKELNNSSAMALALNNIGGSYVSLGLYSKAKTQFLRALVWSKKANDKLRIDLILQELGDVYISLNDFDSALVYLQKALRLSRQIKSKKIELACLNSLSRLGKERGDFKSAYQYLNRYQQLKDSVFSEDKFKEISLLETKYKTAEKNKQIQLQKKEIEARNLKLEQERLIRFVIIGGLFVLFIIAIYMFIMYRHKRRANILLSKQRDEITNQRDNIQQQKQLIEQIHRQVSESIDYAKRLQQAVLPDEHILHINFNDSFVLFKPKDKVSGDFYWWYHTAGETIVTAADCTGHGVPGAFMSMMGITFLREIIVKNNVFQPNLVLTNLRNEIIKVLDQKGSAGEQKDGMDMALIRINHIQKSLQYGGAYNPLYIIRNNAHKLILKGGEELQPISKYEDFYLFEIKADKMPIAIYQRMNDFTLIEFTLLKGDRVFMFSDGYADQFGGPKGKKLKYKAFRNILLKSSKVSMLEQKEFLEKAFENWKGENSQIDDIVVIGIEV